MGALKILAADSNLLLYSGGEIFPTFVAGQGAHQDRGFGDQRQTELSKTHPAQKISPDHILRGRQLQHSLGTLLSVGPAVAISLFGLAAAKLSANLRLSRHGSRPLWDHLLRSGACSGARLVARSRRAAGQAAGADWPVPVDLERGVAHFNDCPVAYQRSDLVDSVHALSSRFMVCIPQRHFPE